MTSSSPIKKRSARRCLFGRSDTKATNEFLHQELEKIKQKQMDKWGFDFDLLSPLPGSSSTFDYVAVDAGSVPDYYRSKVITTPQKQAPVLDKSLNVSPEALDSSMDLSDQELRSAKRKNPKKRRVLPQTHITSFYEIKRKYHGFASKTVGTAVSSPSRAVAFHV